MPTKEQALKSLEHYFGSIQTSRADDVALRPENFLDEAEYEERKINELRIRPFYFLSGQSQHPLRKIQSDQLLATLRQPLAVFTRATARLHHHFARQIRNQPLQNQQIQIPQRILLPIIGIAPAIVSGLNVSMTLHTHHLP
jgi:hypothetical protein